MVCARRYVRGLALLGAVLTSALWADVRQSVVERVAREFHDTTSVSIAHPWLDWGYAQERYFATYLERPDSYAQSATLSYEEYLAVRTLLNSRYRYRLAKAPLSEGDFNYRQTVVATRPSQFAPQALFDRQRGAQGGTLTLSETFVELSQRATGRAPQTSVHLKPRLPHYFYLDKDGRLRRALTESKEGPLTVSLNQRGDNSLDLAMELIASTPSGREVLEAFLKKWQKGEVDIRPLTAKDRESVEKGTRGFCDYDPRTGQSLIYVDPLDPVGSLASTLLHEMVHATKPDHRREYLAEKRALELAQNQAQFEAAMLRRERGILRRELENYAAEDTFHRELTEKFPQASAFYDHLLNIGALVPNASASQIMKLYGLHRLEAPIDLACAGWAHLPSRVPSRSPLSLFDWAGMIVDSILSFVGLPASQRFAIP